MASNVPCCGAEFSLYLLEIVGLVCSVGLMAGLTLGLMSLGLVDLEVLMKSGCPQDRIHADSSHFSGQACASMGCNFGINDSDPHVWRDIATSCLHSLWLESWSYNDTSFPCSSFSFLSYFLSNQQGF
ncbi:hypothetical protein V6N13_005125 [Hibiscus sabdariffa]